MTSTADSDLKLSSLVETIPRASLIVGIESLNIDRSKSVDYIAIYVIKDFHLQ